MSVEFPSNTKRGRQPSIREAILKKIKFDEEQLSKQQNSDIQPDNVVVQTTKVASVKLVVLGNGKGKTAVFDGACSTSFAVFENNEPKLLMDLGFGVTNNYFKYCPNMPLPKTIFISHNHSDHSGELPVVLAVQWSAGVKHNVVCSKDILPTIREHRLHELKSAFENLDDVADFYGLEKGTMFKIPESRLSIQIHEAIHAERCHGFVLYFEKENKEQEPLLGWSADSGYDTNLYTALAEAPLVLLDGREQGNSEHASFEQILKESKNIFKKCEIRITHYGTVAEAPTPDKHGLTPIFEGNSITLWPQFSRIKAELKHEIESRKLVPILGIDVSNMIVTSQGNGKGMDRCKLMKYLREYFRDKDIAPPMLSKWCSDLDSHRTNVSTVFNEIATYCEENGIQLDDIVESILNEQLVFDGNYTPVGIHKAIQWMNFSFIIDSTMDGMNAKLLFQQHQHIQEHTTPQSFVKVLNKDVITNTLLHLYGTQNDAIGIASNFKSSALFAQAMKKLFKRFTVMFFGCCLDECKYLLELGKSKSMRKAYAFILNDESKIEIDNNLVMIYNKPDETYSKVVDFLLDIYGNKDLELLYPMNRSPIEWKFAWAPIQRKEYLQQQLAFEQLATNLQYFTPCITNCLGTAEYIDISCKRSLQQKYSHLDNSYIDSVIKIMHDRRRQVEKIISSNSTSESVVQALFYKDSFDAEFKDESEIVLTLERYRHILYLYERFPNSFEIRMIEDECASAEEKLRNSFGLITFRTESGEKRVAAAHASPANRGNVFAAHVINVGSHIAAVKENIDIFHRFWKDSKTKSVKETIWYIFRKLLTFGNKISVRPMLIGYDKGTLLQGKHDSYVIQKEIGQGGYGKVFKGIVSGTNNFVAIKIPNWIPRENQLEQFELDEDDLQINSAQTGDRYQRFLRKFKHEATALEQLQGCQGIVKLIDFCEPSRYECFIMLEYIEGSTLATARGHKPFTEELTIKIAVKLLGAVSYCHSRDIEHYDITPNNIMVPHDIKNLKNGSFWVKLIDFGIAKVDNDSAFTTRGGNPGTIGFLSPEYSLNRKAADNRSDLYSVAKVLQFCLSTATSIAGTAHDMHGRLIEDRKVLTDQFFIQMQHENRDLRPFQTADDMLGYLRGNRPLPEFINHHPAVNLGINLSLIHSASQ